MGIQVPNSHEGTPGGGHPCLLFETKSLGQIQFTRENAFLFDYEDYPMMNHLVYDDGENTVGILGSDLPKGSFAKLIDFDIPVAKLGKPSQDEIDSYDEMFMYKHNIMPRVDGCMPIVNLRSEPVTIKDKVISEGLDLAGSVVKWFALEAIARITNKRDK